MHRGVFAASLLACLGAGADEPVTYLAPHPPHPAVGGRYCTVTEAHVHDYVPADPSLWIRARGVWVFLGDPTALGFDGPTWLWPGPHPLPVSLGLPGVVCPLEGMHRHAWGPEAPLVVEGTAAVPVVPFWVVDRPVRRRPPPPHDFDTTPPPRREKRPPPHPPATGSFGRRGTRMQRP